MPVAPKRGVDELCFSVLLSLTFGCGERMEKLIRDLGDKNRGSGEVYFIPLNLWETQTKKCILLLSMF